MFLRGNPRIYFSPVGIGLGHIGRCIELAKRLREKRFEAFFSSYGDGVELLHAEGFRAAKAPSLVYWSWPDGTVDIWRSLKWFGIRGLFTILRQLNHELKTIKTVNPRVVVSDTRLTAVMASKLLGVPTVAVLNQLYVIPPGFIHHRFFSTLSRAVSLSAVTHLWALSDKIIIPDFPPPLTIAAENLRAPGAVTRNLHFSGPLLSSRPEDLPDVSSLRETLGLSEGPVVYVALSGPAGERWWLFWMLLKAFTEFAPPLQVVFSLAKRGGRSGARRVGRNGNILIYDWVPDRFSLMKACDIVVGRGSHTTILQALAFGKPLVLIPAPEQTEQIANTRRAVKLGVAIALDQRRISAGALQEAIKTIVYDKGFRENASKFRQAAKILGGIEFVVSEIIKLAGREKAL